MNDVVSEGAFELTHLMQRRIQNSTTINVFSVFIPQFFTRSTTHYLATRILTPFHNEIIRLASIFDLISFHFNFFFSSKHWRWLKGKPLTLENFGTKKKKKTGKIKIELPSKESINLLKYSDNNSCDRFHGKCAL